MNLLPPESAALRKKILEYGIPALAVICLGIFFAAVQHQGGDFFTISNVFFVFAILLFVTTLGYLGVQQAASIRKNLGIVLGVLGTGLLLYVAVVGYLRFKTYTDYASTAISTLCLVLAVFTGLTLFARFYLNYLDGLGGWSRFFARMVFYVPCLFLDLLVYLRHQSRIVPKPTITLLILEAVFLLGYVYLPRVVHWMHHVRGGRVLLSSPVFLVDPHETVLANHLELTDPKTQARRMTFALSAWININPLQTAPKTSQETNVLYYGSRMVDMNNHFVVSNPKPRLTYRYDTQTKKETYVIYYANARHELTIPNQRWNQFVFNYDSHTLDVFVNGNLERTFTTPKIPAYTNDDVIAMGDHQGSIYGAISDVVLYDHLLSSREISAMWNESTLNR